MWRHPLTKLTFFFPIHPVYNFLANIETRDAQTKKKKKCTPTNRKHVSGKSGS